MNRTATIILATTVLVGVTAAAIIAAVKSGMFEREMIEEEEEQRETPRGWFRKLTKSLDRDIDNVERRTSKLYHDKKQENYDNMDWGQEETQHDDIKRNGCPFPVG